MEIIKDNPPFLDDIFEAGMRPARETIYTYGSKIYNPADIPIADHLLKHEETHCAQQGTDPDAWWQRYLNDQYFRIQQETQAYANQYRYICTYVRDRNRRNRVLWDLAMFLAGPMYGSVIHHSDAMRMIKEKSK